MGQANGIDSSTFVPASKLNDTGTGIDPSTFVPDLTPTPGKGIYAMEDESGTQIPISFDKVDLAGKYGYKFSTKITVPNAKGREDYAKDRFATLQPNANTPSVGTKGNLLEGRFFKGGKVVPQTPIPAEVEGDPYGWQQRREAFQAAAVPKGADRPTSPSQTKSLVDSAWNIGANFLDNTRNIMATAANNVFGMADMIPQITSASKDALSSYDPYKAMTGLANLMQMMPGPMAKNYVDHLKEVKKQNPAYAVDDVIGTVIGILASGKLAEKGAKAVSDPVGTAKAIKNAPENIGRATAEAITNTQPRNVKAVGEEALNKALEHKEATQGELGKRSDAHDAEVKKVKEHNARVAEKHKTASEQIEREREASEHELELRRSEEANLHTASEELHEKVAKAEQTAQSEVDKAYAPVHSATAGIKTPLAPLKAVVDVAKSQADPTSSPIFKSIINEGDSVSSTDGVLIVDGQYRPVFSGGKQILFSDPNFDEAYEAQYKEPPPLVGGETDFPRLQRWYTYINSKIYGGGRLEYGTYNALKMTRDAIADSMRSITDASGDVADPSDPSKESFCDKSMG